MKHSSLIDNISFNSYAVQQDYQHRNYFKIKIMLLGAKSVGKSSMLEVYTHQKKPDYQKEEHAMRQGTQGLDFVSKIQEMDNMECKLHIWDTADFKLNSNIPLSLYDGVLGFIIVYDITRRDTYDLVFSITNEIANRGDPNREVFLVGTNADKASQGLRQVSLEEVQKYAAVRRMRVKELSSKNREEVQELFKELTQSIIGNFVAMKIKNYQQKVEQNYQIILWQVKDFKKGTIVVVDILTHLQFDYLPNNFQFLSIISSNISYSLSFKSGFRARSNMFDASKNKKEINKGIDMLVLKEGMKEIGKGQCQQYKTPQNYVCLWIVLY